VGVVEAEAHPIRTVSGTPAAVHSLRHMNKRRTMSALTFITPRSNATSYPFVMENNTSSALPDTFCCARRNTPTDVGGEAGSAYCTNTSTRQDGFLNPAYADVRLPAEPLVL
jgi:hypothetical protein